MGVTSTIRESRHSPPTKHWMPLTAATAFMGADFVSIGTDTGNVPPGFIWAADLPVKPRKQIKAKQEHVESTWLKLMMTISDSFCKVGFYIVDNIYDHLDVELVTWDVVKRFTFHPVACWQLPSGVIKGQPRQFFYWRKHGITEFTKKISSAPWRIWSEIVMLVIIIIVITSLIIHF